MTELKELLTGGHSGQAFVAAFLMALLGIVLRALVSALTRDVHSKRTPIHFDWVFFIRDSAMRLALVIIVTYLFLRFGVTLVPYFGFDPAILDSNPALFVALGIGLFNDWIVKKIQNKIKEKQKEK